MGDGQDHRSVVLMSGLERGCEVGVRWYDQGHGGGGRLEWVGGVGLFVEGRAM